MILFMTALFIFASHIYIHLESFALSSVIYIDVEIATFLQGQFYGFMWK